MRVLSVILLLIGSVAESLKLTRVHVPHYKVSGEDATLECKFELGVERLYAVKWYKDNEEFFRYVPRFNPTIHAHKVEGVHVDIVNSDRHKVVLKKVNVRSTGVYRCEASAEAPSFSSILGEGRMTVVYLPKEGPQITGTLRDEYEVGDTLDLNCTSSKSFPPAKISWYINDIPVTANEEPTEEFLANLKPGTYVGKVLKFRVTLKSEKKNTSVGEIFEFHGIDKTGEMGFVCYKNTSELFFDKIDINSLLKLENFNVNLPNPKYPTGANLVNVVRLLQSSFLTELDVNDPSVSSIPNIPFQFSSLRDVENPNVGEKLDVVAIIVDIGELEAVKSVTGTNYAKRDLVITDQSKTSIVLTTWGSTAEKFSVQLYQAVAIRKAYVSEYVGIKSFNSRNDTLIWANSSLDEVNELQTWFQSEWNKK